MRKFHKSGYGLVLQLLLVALVMVCLLLQDVRLVMSSSLRGGFLRGCLIRFRFSILLFPSSQATTNAVDQAALGAIWNGFASKGFLVWNTTSSLCGKRGVTCSSGKVT